MVKNLKFVYQMANCSILLENISLRKVFSFGSLLCAYFCFIYFSWNVLHEFLEERTGISEMLLDVTELPLPAITVCSKHIFKNTNYVTKQDDLLQNLPNHVFKVEEFFHPKFLKHLNHWNPHEIFSSRLGLCFSFHQDKNLTLNTPDYQSRLQFLIGKKYQVLFC